MEPSIIVYEEVGLVYLEKHYEDLWRNQGRPLIYWSPTVGFNLALGKTNIFTHITASLL